LVLPGDILVADDDGAVIIPAKMAPMIVKNTLEHEEWETFSRAKLEAGGSIWKYYPLSEEGRQEYEEWKKTQGGMA
jgi:regulator of RNase E activity RraA